MITVACVWVHGHVRYGVEYVTRLRAMVAAHLAEPHRFVCLTDQPWAVPATIETIPVPCPAPLFGWWSKVQLFAPGRFEGRVLYLDLDSLVVADLAPLADYPSAFALVPPGGTFTPPLRRAVLRRFNSSVMVWDADGPATTVYAKWTPAVARRWWGDQDHIGDVCPFADLMPPEWFPRLSAIQGGPLPAAARVVLAKVPKPVEAARRWPWVAAVWGTA